MGGKIGIMCVTLVMVESLRLGLSLETHHGYTMHWYINIYIFGSPRNEPDPPIVYYAAVSCAQTNIRIFILIMIIIISLAAITPKPQQI